MNIGNKWVLLLVLVGGVATLPAAHFVVEHQSLYADSDAIAESLNVPEQSNYWGDWGEGYVQTSSFIELWYEDVIEAMATASSDANCYLIPFVNYEGDFAGAYVEAGASSNADLTYSNGVHAHGWANISSVAPGLATGQFYRIEPDGDENNGDLVTLSVDYLAEITTSIWSADVSGSVHGGFAGDNLLITRNCVDWDNPQPSEIILSYEKKDLDGVYEEYDAIQVAIGDIIGVHFGLSVEAETYTITGQGDVDVDLSLAIIITSYDGPPPFDPARADLNDDGRVDLLDLALFTSAWLWEEQIPQ